jgi:hypothetical protein
VDPTNDRELFEQIKKHYSRFGNNIEINIKRLSHFCTSQVNGIEKLGWLKILELLQQNKTCNNVSNGNYRD